MRNRLLNGLAPDDLARLNRHLHPVDLTVRSVMQHPEEPTSEIYFVETGLMSVIAVSGAEQVEVALVGSEGFTGAQAVLGCDDWSTRTVVQCPGGALRIDVAELRRQMAESPTLSHVLMRFVSFTLAQVGHTALANGRFTLEQRLARWLLMAHDRLDTNDIALTHDFLSIMLGVRRPGVTVALHMLEGAHAIRSRRNSIVILDRARLRATAGPSYGVPEATYLALFGSPLAKDAGAVPAKPAIPVAAARDPVVLSGS